MLKTSRFSWEILPFIPLLRGHLWSDLTSLSLHASFGSLMHFEFPPLSRQRSLSKNRTIVFLGLGTRRDCPTVLRSFKKIVRIPCSDSVNFQFRALAFLTLRVSFEALQRIVKHRCHGFNLRWISKWKLRLTVTFFYCTGTIAIRWQPHFPLNLSKTIKKITKNQSLSNHCL